MKTLRTLTMLVAISSITVFSLAQAPRAGAPQGGAAPAGGARGPAGPRARVGARMGSR